MNTRSLGLLILLVSASPLRAETTVLDALVDFDDLAAGEVPYYREGGRGSVAIDAAVTAYRDRFARAVATFAGAPGVHDLTLETLAETDGETVYRLFVDDALVGAVTNAPVEVDFTVQRHVFDGIELATGSRIAIESKAVSNERIPEGEGYAFARGRWRSLTIEDDPLGMSLTDPPVGADEIDPADPFFLTDLTDPVAPVNVVDPSVTTDPSGPADPPDVSLVTDGAGSADPVDPAGTPGPTAPSPELRVVASVSSAAPGSGERVTLDVRVSNPSKDTVATHPFITVALPDGIAFEASADCVPDLSALLGADGDAGRRLRCDLPELAPEATTTLSVALLTLSTGRAEIGIVGGADDLPGFGGEAVTAVSLDVLADAGSRGAAPDSGDGDPAAAPVTASVAVPSTDAVGGGAGGGGAGAPCLLAVLLGALAARRRASGGAAHR